MLLFEWLTFTGHHWSRFKALLARTLEASHHIGAGSISTWVSYGALVSVWRRVGTQGTAELKPVKHLYISGDLKALIRSLNVHPKIDQDVLHSGATGTRTSTLSSKYSVLLLWFQGSFGYKALILRKCCTNFNFREHLTNTVDSSVIQVVSEGAFAAERTVCVDADTILADAWVIQTLIHI